MQGAVADTSISLGAEYSEGDYGTGETTTSWYVPFSWRYAGTAFSAAITIPYLSVSGSSLVTFDGRPLAPGGMSGGGGGGGSTTHTDSGLGDVLLSGGYQLLDGANEGLWMSVRGIVKLGTADAEKGLGSGENDYTVQLEAAMGALSGYTGYTLIGDTDTIDYNDVAFVGVALDFPLGKRHGLGLEYYSEQASLDGMDDVQEATISLGGPVSRGLNYSLYYTAGLSDSSAESLIGVNFSTPMK
jgi:hypothetical protein